MPDVKVKLSADGSQLRREIKLIDQELKQVGRTGTSSAGSQPQELGKATKPGDKAGAATATKDYDAEDRTRVLSHLDEELKQLRKELQKINSNNSTAPAAPRGGSSGLPSTGSGTGTSPATTGTGSPATGTGKWGEMLGKLASAAVAIQAASRVKSYITQGAQSSLSGESQAYQTYGSTLAYNDYYNAKKDAYNMGFSYGYDYNTVLSAADTNISAAGFTTTENHQADMTALLATSKAWGIDANQLSSTSGSLSAMGVTESGNQKAFADLLAESIVQAGMQGRESEQLQVLEGIAENLASVNATVSEDSVRSSLSMYNALVNQNENLKGSRGAGYIEDLQSLASSGNSTLDVLAGFGTQYTGLAGKQELRRLAEEDPEQFYRQVAQGMQAYNVSDSQMAEILYQALGSQHEADEAMELIKGIGSGRYNDLTDTTAGQRATQERLDNYNAADISTLEQYPLKTQDVQETLGEGWNNLTVGPKGWFNGLSTGEAVGTTAAVAAAGYGAKQIGGKLVSEGIGTAIKGGTEAVKAAKATGESAGIGTAVKGATAAVKDSSGDILKGVGKTAGKLSKAAPVVGTVIEVGTTALDVTEALNEGDTKRASEAAGGGIGSILGGIGGGIAAGAIAGSVVPGIGNVGGAIIGGIGGLLGALAGDAVGSAAGGAIHDAVTGDNQDLRQLAEENPEEYYKQVSQGMQAHSMSDSQLNEVLYQSLGSQHEADKAMRLIDGGSGGSFSGGVARTEENTESLVQNTAALEELTDALSKNGGLDSDAGWTTQTTSGTSLAQQSSRVATTGRSASSASSSSTSATTTNSNNSSGNIFTDIANGIGDFFGGLFGTSHATGNDYVPYDNYLASLHKGEMVLTKYEADQYRQGQLDNAAQSATGMGVSEANINIHVSGKIEGMTSSNQNQIVQAVIAQLNQGSNSINLQQLLPNGFQRRPNY